MLVHGLVTACILGAGSDQALHRSVSSIDELGWDRVVVEPRRGEDSPDDPVAAFEAGRRQVQTPWSLLLLAGEVPTVLHDRWLADDLNGGADVLAVHERSGSSVLADPLRPGLRLLRGHVPLPPWGELSPAGTRTALELAEGTAPLETGSPAAQWLLEIVDRRTRARAQLAAPQEAAREAAVLAWAGEYDGALARARRLLSPEVPTADAVAAARVCLAAGLASGRATDAVRGALTWLLRTGEPTAAGWAGLVAGLVGDVRLSRTIPLPDRAGDLAEPWLPLLGAGMVRHARENAEHTADELVNLLAADTPPLRVRRLVDLWLQLDRDVAALVRRWPPEAAPLLLAVLDHPPATPPDDWLLLLDGWVQVKGWEPALVRRLLDAAPSMDLEQARQWAGRLASSRTTTQSLLAVRAAAPALSAEERLLSAAVALHDTQDRRFGPVVRDLAAQVPMEQFGELLLRVDELAPTALPAAITGAASTVERTLAVATLLDGLGAHEQADELRRAASSP